MILAAASRMGAFDIKNDDNSDARAPPAAARGEAPSHHAYPESLVDGHMAGVFQVATVSDRRDKARSRAVEQHQRSFIVHAP